MYQPTRYLRWARRFYGLVPFDLATSGIATVARSELGAPASSDDPAGWHLYREAIARYTDAPPAEVIATLGTTQALWLAYTALLSPGDEVLVERPGYEPLERIAEGVGGRVVSFERSRASGYAIDPAAIERAMTDRTRVVVVTNLHNPSGVRASDAALRDVARLAESRGAYLLVAEVYAPFDAIVDSAGVFRSSARKLGPNVIVASSLTKCFGLGPQRFGWMVAPADVIRRAEDAMDSLCSSLPLAYAHEGLHALSRIEFLADRARRLLAGKRARVAAWVAAQPDLTWSAPTEGLFGFVVRDARSGAGTPGAGARGSRGDDLDLLARIERGAKELGVLVAPGVFFGVPNGFRLAWSIEDAKLDEGLDRLARVLARG